MVSRGSVVLEFGVICLEGLRRQLDNYRKTKCIERAVGGDRDSCLKCGVMTSFMQGQTPGFIRGTIYGHHVVLRLREDSQYHTRQP